MTGEIEEPKVSVRKGEAPALPEKEAMRTFTDSAEIFQLMESRDEKQMMQDILGVYAKEYVYDIPFKGEAGSVKCDTPNCSLAVAKTKHTHVRGLSWAGIKEARRIFQGIDTQQVSVPQLVDQDGKELWDCSVSAIDLRTGNSTTVHKRQPLLKETRGGKLIPDPFAYEIVQSKAKRNAIAELLPQPLVRAWIKDWIVGKKDFDPKHAINLKKDEDYKVDDSQKDEQPPISKPTWQRNGSASASKPTELQFKKVYAQWHEIEERGGQSFADTREKAKEFFKVKTLQDLTRQQVSRIIDDNIKQLAKLSLQQEAETDEPHDIDQVETPEPTDDSKVTPSATDKVKAIKATLSELGWSPTDPASSAMLKTHGISTLDELDKASPETLEAILADLG